MASAFDSETLDLLRGLPPRQAFDTVKDMVYRSGASTSEDFREAYEDLVEHGILTWEQLDEFES